MVEKLYRRRRRLIQKLDVITDVQEVIKIREELRRIEETLDCGRVIGKQLLKEFDIFPAKEKSR